MQFQVLIDFKAIYTAVRFVSVILYTVLYITLYILSADMIEMRQSKASMLKVQCERSEQLKETEVNELRADIKVKMKIFVPKLYMNIATYIKYI